MKCINCGTDNNLKDRTANQGQCKQCQHQFAFEPTSASIKITDGMFAKFITTISANDTLFFTPKQLYYFLDSRLKYQLDAIGIIMDDLVYIDCFHLPIYHTSINHNYNIYCSII